MSKTKWFTIIGLAGAFAFLHYLSHWFTKYQGYDADTSILFVTIIVFVISIIFGYIISQE